MNLNNLGVRCDCRQADLILIGCSAEWRVISSALNPRESDTRWRP